MKKIIGNAALIDARKLTPETAKIAPEIRNAAVILVSEQSKELLMELRIGNVSSVVCVPEEVSLYTVNGKGTLSTGALAEKQVFILVNGMLTAKQDVTPEAIAKNVAGGIINGKLFCSVSHLAALHGCGVQVNGTAEAYPDGCRLREGDRPITAMEATALSEGERLYLCKRTLLEKGALEMLNKKSVRLYGAGLILYESEAEKASACWQGDTSRIRLVQDEYRILVGNRRINRRNAPTFRGALEIIGDVIIDSDVEPQMLMGLQSLRMEGTLWVPMALMQQMLEKANGDVEWMPYEGTLLCCEDVLTLTGEMARNWPERVTLYNSGVLAFAKDMEPEALQKHIALLHNAGKITLTKAQHGAVRMVVTGAGVIDEYQEEEEKKGTADEEKTLGNAAWLVL